ncbi:hypothetical protein RIF29_27480 [Crotalaria pallida]|uniref:GDSL esterase/lipase n=1 Tax=Crotalaria pallida TaxID=3830 RepID=A0AAN9I2E1_CROPI
MDRLHIETLLMIVLVFFGNNVPIVSAAFPALFAFGDSILDTGNNNNLQTISKCNFPPYGRDFDGGKPTGRFGNGKVPSDLIAEGLGIKNTLPAYNDPNLGAQDLPTGVCFASGGSGSDNVTSSLLRVISLSDQLGMFKDYIGKLSSTVGQQNASNIISNSLFLLSVGNNDIAITYSSSGRRVMPFPSYANLLVGWTSTFLKDLYGLGARHVWVLSTLPLGCLPSVRASVGGAQCNGSVNGLAVQYNGMLQQLGFINAVNGCCGGMALAFGQVCTLLTGQCVNPSRYIFWDFGHPTEKAYQIIVSSILQNHK